MIEVQYGSESGRALRPLFAGLGMKRRRSGGSSTRTSAATGRTFRWWSRVGSRPACSPPKTGVREPPAAEADVRPKIGRKPRLSGEVWSVRRME